MDLNIKMKRTHMKTDMISDIYRFFKFENFKSYILRGRNTTGETYEQICQLILDKKRSQLNELK